MAGIGWKLQRLIDRDTLAGQVAAYMTGVAVTSAPWLLTTAVLVVLRLTSREARAAELSGAEQLMTWVYAVTMVVCSPVQVVASRYAADRLYDLKIDGIAAPLRRVLAATLVGGFVIGVAMVSALEVPRALAVPIIGLTVIVGGQWLMLSVGGGLCSPIVVLRAYAVGAPISILSALALERGFDLGGPGYATGFALGQLVALALLIAGTFHALPEQVDETARVTPAFRTYWMLAVAVFVYHVAIWIDKVAVRLVLGTVEAERYTTAAAFAWLTVVPALAWIYVQIETTFYQRYRSYYDGIEGGATLNELRGWSAGISSEARRIVGGAAMIQLLVTAIAVAAASPLMGKAQLGAAMVPTFRWLLVGSALLLVTLLGLVLLAYFDRRRESLIVSIVLLVANFALTLVAGEIERSPAVGYVIGCGIACVLSVWLVRSRLDSLLVDTFQSQPFSG